MRCEERQHRGLCGARLDQQRTTSGEQVRRGGGDPAGGVEAVVAAEPDLILNGGRFAQYQEQLGQLAPDAAMVLLDPREDQPLDAELKWMHRLKDMENKLKAEREGRRLDRNEASRKIISLEEVALQAQAREAKIERRRRMEAALSIQGSGDKSGSGGGKRSPSAGGL